MGARSSRLGSRPSRKRVNTTNDFSLVSFLCGGSASRAMDEAEMDDHPVEPQAYSSGSLDPTITGVQKGREESSSACCVGTRGSISTAEIGTSSMNLLEFCNSTVVEESAGCIATVTERKNLSEIKELIPPPLVSSDHSSDESSRDSSGIVSSSFVGQQSSDPVAMNIFANEAVVNGVGNSVDKGVSQTISKANHPRSSTFKGFGDSSSGTSSVENHVGEVSQVQILEPDSASQVSDFPVTSHILGRESFEEPPPSGLGFVMSDRERDGNVVHVDEVSVSTNILPISDIDPSNNSGRRARRLFWDTFSRHNSRRHGDSPNRLFPASDNDRHSSRDRWLLDLTGDLFSDRVGNDSGRMGSRIHRLNEQRRHSRFEIWERLRGGLDEINHWNNSCPLGLHPGSDCACEVNPVTDESSTRANISRIVMLAEALFEVLDEIHRQPVSFSLSMVSIPAPESIVDSFPLKHHKKVEPSEGGIDVEQCYICLADYEEGDKIRVLPCQHEYHMACVDKWLKEIHGVCPLCRGDVCEGLGDSTAPNELAHSRLH